MAEGYFTIEDCSGCCETCGPTVYGETFILDISGLVSCGCVQFPAPDFDGLYHLIDFPDGYPTEFELTYGGVQWDAPPVDVTYSEFNGTEPTCDPQTTGVPGTLTASAQCVVDPGGELDGKLLVTVVLSGGRYVYAAYFEAIDTAQPNILECGVVAFGAPSLYFDGTGTISAP